MDGSQNLVHAQAVFHRHHVFSQKVARVRAHNRHAQNFVLARYRQHFHEPVCFTVGNRAVQVVNAVLHHLVRNILFFGFLLVQADTSHLRINKRCPRNHRIINFEFPEGAKQRVDRRVPSLVRGDMGELEWPGHVARGVNIRVDRLQVLVGGNGPIDGNSHFLQPVAREACHPANGAQQCIELNADFFAVRFHDDGFDITDHTRRFFTAQSLVPGQHLHAVSLQRLAGQLRHLHVLTDHDARGHLDLRDLRAQPLEALRQLAANGATAQYDHALWNGIKLQELIPQRVAGNEPHIVDAR